jgi:hypothetical protein
MKRRAKYKIARDVETSVRSYGSHRLVYGVLMKMKNKRNKRVNSHFVLYAKQKDVGVFLGYPFFFSGSYRKFRYIGSSIGRKRKLSRLTEARL